MVGFTIVDAVFVGACALLAIACVYGLWEHLKDRWRDD